MPSRDTQQAWLTHSLLCECDGWTAERCRSAFDLETDERDDATTLTSAPIEDYLARLKALVIDKKFDIDPRRPHPLDVWMSARVPIDSLITISDFRLVDDGCHQTELRPRVRVVVGCCEARHAHP